MKKGSILMAALIWTIYCSGQTTYYSNSSTTNFNTLSGWSLNADGTGSNPAAMNNTVRLIVQNGHSKTTSAVATVNQLTIQSGGTVTASHAISVNGTGMAFNINNAGTYIHNNTGTLSSTIFAGIETFGASSTFQVNNWESTSQSIIPSSLSLSAVGFDGNSYYYGNLIINWATVSTWVQGWGTSIYRLAAGNWQLTSGFTGTFQFTPSSGSAVQPQVYVGGNFTMNGGTINFTARSDPSYIFVNGDVTQTAGTLATTGNGNGSSGNIRTYGTTSANWTFTGGTRKLIGYRITANKTVNIKANFNMGQPSDAGWVFSVILYVEANAVLDVETYTISCSYATQLGTAGKIRTSNTNGLVGSTTTALSNSPTVQWGIVTNCTAEYYATGAQTVSAVPIYENVTIMNSGTKVLAGNATVFKVFNFTGSDNYLNLNANNLTITNTGSISNSGSTSYFICNPTTGTNGRLRQNGLAATAARVFPVGTATNYLPVTITPASAGSDFSVNVFRSTTTDGLPGGPAFGPISAPRTDQVDAMYWISRDVGSGVNAQIRFDWQTSAIEGEVFSALSLNQIGIWVRKAGWVLAAGNGSTNYVNDNTSNFSQTNGNLTDFGTAGTGYPYYVANIVTLPFRFTKLNVSKTNNGSAYLEWQLDNDVNVDYFEVEESSEGITFTKLTKIFADGSKPYHFTNQLLNNGVNYYRVKAVSKEGESVYSAIVALNNKQAASLQLLNNPVVSQLVFKHPAAVNAGYRITDLMGRTLMSGRITPSAVITQIDVSNLTTGTYILQFINDGEQIINQFIRN